MVVLREVGVFKLNKGDSMANGLFNVTHDELMNSSNDEGVSLWFDAETKDELMKLNDSMFVDACNVLMRN